MQERSGLLEGGLCGDNEEPPNVTKLLQAKIRMSLAMMAHTRLSRLRLDYDLLGLIAEHMVDFRPIHVVCRVDQIHLVRTNDPALGVGLNWYHSGCSDADVAALVDALSCAAGNGTPTLRRLYLHGNPRITDTSAPGLLQVATSSWSNIELINLDDTSMCAEKRFEIAARVNERRIKLWNESLELQRAQALRDEPARKRRAQQRREQESCRRRKKECMVGLGVAGAFLMLKVVWLIAGWIGDW
eukprot:COSAG02_NODE_8119_length_2701_cov_2.463105_2_plen_243_part_00